MKKLKNIDLNQEVDLSKVKEKSKGFWNEFKAFAIKGNAIDLAIGMVIGAIIMSILLARHFTKEPRIKLQQGKLKDDADISIEDAIPYLKLTNLE